MLPRATCAAGFALAVAGKAVACGGSVGVSTDNLLRGSSLSGERPAWLLDLHCEPAAGWIAGLGASRVHLVGRSANIQWSTYLDRRWQVGEDWAAKVGVAHYDGARRAGEDGLRYDEVNAAIGFRGRWRLSVAFSPNATDIYYRGALAPVPALAPTRNRMTWVETTLHQPFMDSRLALDAGVGVAIPSGDRGSSYRYGNVGVRWQWRDASFFVTRIHTSAIRWRFELLGLTYEMDLPPRNAWMGTIVWGF